MASNVFKFKRFSVSHGRSSMKIGVDGVLIGAWSDLEGATRILDAGTGCGVIALMCAQRSEMAHIDAIDIDADSICEASNNFENSPWQEQLKAIQTQFCTMAEDEKYDLIISNPPFFKSGVNPEESRRMSARHQGELSPFSLMEKGKSMLKASGRLCMIFPSDQLEDIAKAATSQSWGIKRVTKVRGHAAAPIKRVLIELVNGEVGETEQTELTLETTPGTPTEAYRNLCKDFYLKF